MIVEVSQPDPHWPQNFWQVSTTNQKSSVTGVLLIFPKQVCAPIILSYYSLPNIPQILLDRWRKLRCNREAFTKCRELKCKRWKNKRRIQERKVIHRTGRLHTNPNWFPSCLIPYNGVVFHIFSDLRLHTTITMIMVIESAQWRMVPRLYRRQAIFMYKCAVFIADVYYWWFSTIAGLTPKPTNCNNNYSAV